MSAGLWLGTLAASGIAGGNFESIATVTVGSGGASSIQFTSIPSTYQHLQLRFSVENPNGANGLYTITRVNSDSSSNYAGHVLYGNGSSAGAAGYANQTSLVGMPNTGFKFAGINDVLDYANTSKFKTFRILIGSDNNGSGSVDLWGGLWRSTNVITSITMSALSQGNSSTFGQHSHFGLYGIKAP